jgi:hypothetical protein
MSFQNEIRAFFDEYEARWNSKRFGALGELWDHDDTMPFYRPMEVDGYISQWKDLERCWEPKPGTSFIDDLNSATPICSRCAPTWRPPCIRLCT